MLVSFYSFLSLYLVKYDFKIVIVASEVVESEASEKLENDVRKNTRQKKIMCCRIFLPDLRGFPDLLPDAMGWGWCSKTVSDV